MDAPAPQPRQFGQYSGQGYGQQGYYQHDQSNQVPMANPVVMGTPVN